MQIQDWLHSLRCMRDEPNADVTGCAPGETGMDLGSKGHRTPVSNKIQPEKPHTPCIFKLDRKWFVKAAEDTSA